MKCALRFTLLFCLLLPCQVVRGQPTPPQAGCADNPACEALAKQAEQQVAAGQLAEALRSYKLAHEVVADPRLLYSIARLMHLQGQEIDAVPYYRRFIESNLDDEAQKVRSKEYLAQCESIAAEALAKKMEAERKEKERNEVKRAELTIKPVPLYKKWWFWTIIGTAAAAGIAGGIAGGVIANQNQIPDPSFRPF